MEEYNLEILNAYIIDTLQDKEMLECYKSITMPLTYNSPNLQELTKDCLSMNIDKAIHDNKIRHRDAMINKWEYNLSTIIKIDNDKDFMINAFDTYLKDNKIEKELLLILKEKLINLEKKEDLRVWTLLFLANSKLIGNRSYELRKAHAIYSDTNFFDINYITSYTPADAMINSINYLKGNDNIAKVYQKQKK